MFVELLDASIFDENFIKHSSGEVSENSCRQRNVSWENWSLEKRQTIFDAGTIVIVICYRFLP